MNQPLNVFWYVLVRSALHCVGSICVVELLAAFVCDVAVDGDDVVVVADAVVVDALVAVVMTLVALLLLPDDLIDDDCELLDVAMGIGAVAHNGDNSCRPNSFSSSFGSFAPGRSCLLANINIGTPCNNNYYQLVIRINNCRYSDGMTNLMAEINYLIILTFHSSH